MAQAGDPGGAPLDARSLREHRRPGCDLPADGLLDHRTAMPRLRAWTRRRCGGRCEQLDDLQIAEGDRVRVQPCVSPVWDTAIATISLADAGLPSDHPSWNAPVDWLLDKEVRHRGDWQIRRPGLEPTGWHFQFHNAFYPDLDDSAMVLLGLLAVAAGATSPAVVAATRRGVDWLLSMQNRDGGWAAYDVDIDNQVLTKLPFADHNAMLDPSCADITARVLELLGTLGYRAGPPVGRARPRVSFARRRSRKGAGTAAGGSTTSTAPGRSCRGSAPSTSRWITRRSSRPCAGSSRPSSPPERGARRAEATTTRPQGHRRADPVADRLGHARADRGRTSVERRRCGTGSTT